MTRTSAEHFEVMWQRLGLSTDAKVWHRKLTGCYTEPGRFYHTLQHLEECLLAFDEARAAGQMKNPDLIEMALWFHDAVYDPRSSDNEASSAQMTAEAMVGHHASKEVAELIMLTKSHLPGTGVDDAWIIDIDLGIFARPWQRVLEYEGQIRREYDWVPEDVYQQKRAEILRAFLQRDSIYQTNVFRTKWEMEAKLHLARLLEIVKG
jgi:predicted metal-dependent HD superfamily phosphohydrolase